jgi:hypothetical protein
MCIRVAKEKILLAVTLPVNDSFIFFSFVCSIYAPKGAVVTGLDYCLGEYRGYPAMKGISLHAYVKFELSSITLCSHSYFDSISWHCMYEFKQVQDRP